MCRNYRDISFTHFVTDRTGTIFACGRENGHTYTFLIREGAVSVQCGEYWRDLDAEFGSIIRSRAEDAYGRVPIYRISQLIFN